MLSGKTIVLGVTGSIAAYKAAEIIRSLKKLNADVQVIITEAATHFISPLTLQTLSENQVAHDMFAESEHWEIEHISLAKKADLLLIAPATANIIGKLASGIADDMLSTTVLATRAPVLIAPAMNTNMYDHPINIKNMEILKEIGYYIIEAGYGLLACGDEGRGKLADVELIVEKVVQILNKRSDFKGRRILVTAGGTQEPLDPVRFIANHSTGKMGYALAEAARDRGAEVILVSAPTHLPDPPGVKIVRIITANDMRRSLLELFPSVEVVIMAAAVADYRPKRILSEKIKRKEEKFILELERIPDIIAELGKNKGDKILIGFAAETQDLIENARIKLERKNLDMIVANDLKREGAGFGSDTNIVTLIYRGGKTENLPIMSKREVAERILDRVKEMIDSR